MEKNKNKKDSYFEMGHGEASFQQPALPKPIISIFFIFFTTNLFSQPIIFF